MHIYFHPNKWQEKKVYSLAFMCGENISVHGWSYVYNSRLCAHQKAKGCLTPVCEQKGDGCCSYSQQIAHTLVRMHTLEEMHVHTREEKTKDKVRSDEGWNTRRLKSKIIRKCLGEDITAQCVCVCVNACVCVCVGKLFCWWQWLSPLAAYNDSSGETKRAAESARLVCR